MYKIIIVLMSIPILSFAQTNQIKHGWNYFEKETNYPVSSTISTAWVYQFVLNVGITRANEICENFNNISSRQLDVHLSEFVQWFPPEARGELTLDTLTVFEKLICKNDLSQLYKKDFNILQQKLKNCSLEKWEIPAAVIRPMDYKISIQQGVELMRFGNETCKSKNGW